MKLNPTILVIDDDLDLLELTQLVLEEAGFVALTAATGGAALRALASGMRPDLVIADLWMPGMSGAEFCAAARRLPGLEKLPIVLVSAGPQTKVAPGVIGFLRKPFGPEALLAAVRAFGIAPPEAAGARQ
jgi:CheY-like chemotaxis protein